MWPQTYTPVAGSLGISALVAAIPVFALLVLLGVLRKPAWLAALAGLLGAAAVALAAYRMPVGHLIGAVGYGAAQGLFPIGWVVFSAILLYRVTVESGKFEIIKDSVGSLTEDRRLQALLIAFAFGAFIEGAAGFGTPVAVCAAMLTGLGFSPFYAAAICLLANTAPVAFGSIGTPIMMLQTVTKLPMERLSAGVGRVCAPVSLIVPAYLVAVMGGWKALRGVFPAAATCGLAFAVTQFLVSNYVSAQLTDILASLAAIASLVVLFRVWTPRDRFALDHAPHAAEAAAGGSVTNASHAAHKRHTTGELIAAWGPYLVLVLLVLVWGYPPVQRELNATNLMIKWPGLHNLVQIVPPVAGKAMPYDATYKFGWLSAPGTACLIAAVLASFIVGMPPVKFVHLFWRTVKQLAVAELTIAAVLALAFVMNYSGATATLGLAFAGTGVLFPFFSSLLGWLGVFLTGSDTSANALFGNLQVITAGKLGMNPVLMAASNSAGGVMGKMISLTSIAVASAATAMKREDEAKLFRFTLKHSVLLASVIGLIVVFYAYVAPQLAP